MTAPAPECAALTEGLRAVRARTGLSLTGLAERTPYSRSSWERYLNGKKPVPRQAVEALCAMAGEPSARLLALWELADAEWSGRARSARPAVPSAPSVPPASAGPRGTGAFGRVRRAHWFVVGAGVAVVIAAMTGVLIVVLSVLNPGTAHPARAALPPLDPAPGCQGRTCDGKDPDRVFCGLPGRVDSLGPEHRTATGAHMEIRYSTVCDAAWGRIWHTRVGDAIELSAPGVPSRRIVVKNAVDTTVYRFTSMIGAPSRATLRLCFLPVSGTGGRECVSPG
ncbi:XRE family transcriptional regulator [Streptomyces sp. WELS2]|uniref:helix-turn-helix domain-containing protein n=1 Tax=Streptomyces sp. WELS2 TaxID=2749435 RepID=UPI0015F07BE0|nr:XRE family transcriptional regulator [Streptomyces sp. WELS2]